MKRQFIVCVAFAVAVLPGALPLALGVFAARAIRRVVLRRRVKRIVVAAGPGRVWNPDARAEA